MKREEIVEVIKALMGDDLDEQVRVVKGVFSHFCNVDSAAKDAVTSAFMSAEIETEKCLEAFWKRVLKHEQDSVKYLDFNCSEDSVREQRIVEVLMFLLMHCGPSGLVLIPDLSKLLRVEEVDPRFRLYRLESVACSALASIGEHAIAEFETIYSYVLKENELSGKALISVFCKFDESILERIIDDVRELEDELIVDRVDLISYVARENALENREDIKEVFVGLLKHDDEDVVYTAMEHLNATALDDIDIQNLINEVQSKIDEEEDDDVIDAADFDYVYEGKTFNYWLEQYLENRDYEKAGEIVSACLDGFTGVDDFTCIDEESHLRELNARINIWSEENNDQKVEVFDFLLKGLLHDLVLIDVEDLEDITDAESEKRCIAYNRVELDQKLLVMMAPFVPEAISLLEELKDEFNKTEQRVIIIAKLASACDVVSSILPQELMGVWVDREETSWPSDFTNAIATMCRKNTSLLDIVHAKLMTRDEQSYQTISFLIEELKEVSLSLVDPVIATYETGGEGERLFASSVAIYSKYESRAEVLTRSMLLSDDFDLRGHAMFHSALLNNDNVDLVLHALSDEESENRTIALLKVQKLEPDREIAEKLVEMLDDAGWAPDYSSVASEALRALSQMSEFSYLGADKLRSILGYWLSSKKVKDEKNRDEYKTEMKFESECLWRLKDLITGFEAMGEHAKIAKKEIQDTVNYLSTREASGLGTRVMRLKKILELIEH